VRTSERYDGMSKVHFKRGFTEAKLTKELMDGVHG
jgi:hypothetical protein